MGFLYFFFCQHHGLPAASRIYLRMDNRWRRFSSIIINTFFVLLHKSIFRHQVIVRNLSPSSLICVPPIPSRMVRWLTHICLILCTQRDFPASKQSIFAQLLIKSKFPMEIAKVNGAFHFVVAIFGIMSPAAATIPLHRVWFIFRKFKFHFWYYHIAGIGCTFWTGLYHQYTEFGFTGYGFASRRHGHRIPADLFPDYIFIYISAWVAAINIRVALWPADDVPVLCPFNLLRCPYHIPRNAPRCSPDSETELSAMIRRPTGCCLMSPCNIGLASFHFHVTPAMRVRYHYRRM